MAPGDRLDLRGAAVSLSVALFDGALEAEYPGYERVSLERGALRWERTDASSALLITKQQSAKCLAASSVFVDGFGVYADDQLVVFGAIAPGCGMNEGAYINFDLLIERKSSLVEATNLLWHLLGVCDAPELEQRSELWRWLSMEANSMRFARCS